MFMYKDILQFEKSSVYIKMAHRYHFYRTANINNTPRKYFILIPKQNVSKNRCEFNELFFLFWASGKLFSRLFSLELDGSHKHGSG